MEQNEILIWHGTGKEAAKAVLKAAKIEELIDSASGGDRASAKIALKPNLVVDAPASSGATTHPELVAGAIEYLQEQGFRKIKVIEGSWVGSRTMEACEVNGLRAVCTKYGVPFVDLQKDSSQAYDAAGMQMRVCDEAMDGSFLINMPVLKGHCQTSITCALKNAKGVIPNAEKRRFHTLGLHKPIAHLNTVVHWGFILVDNLCGDLDFEEGGNPVTMNRVLGFLDPVLCDSFVCRTMGYDIREVPYIGMAERLGVGSSDLNKASIQMLNEPVAAPQKSTRRIQALARYAAPDCACSACYGSLIYALNKLEQDFGRLSLPEQVCIGQGYRGKSGKLGVGTCTCKFAQTLGGCPPTAGDIYDFLARQMRR